MTVDKDTPMKQASAAQLELTRRLLARELRTLPDPAAAAAQAYERILLHLAPLVGTAGVHALFTRSAKMAQAEHPELAEMTDPSSRLEAQETPMGMLRSSLQKQAPETIAASAEALFSNFFSLLAAFIGERLTAQVLQGVWPEQADPDPAERKP